MPSKVAPCSCKHPQQDAMHGPGNRVHNSMQFPKNPNTVRGWKCTVCGEKKDA